jgi:hypothetical protein
MLSLIRLQWIHRTYKIITHVLIWLNRRWLILHMRFNSFWLSCLLVNSRLIALHLSSLGGIFKRLFNLIVLSSIFEIWIFGIIWWCHFIGSRQLLLLICVIILEFFLWVMHPITSRIFVPWVNWPPILSLFIFWFLNGFLWKCILLIQII